MQRVTVLTAGLRESGRSQQSIIGASGRFCPHLSLLAKSRFLACFLTSTAIGIGVVAASALSFLSLVVASGHCYARSCIFLLT